MLSHIFLFGHRQQHGKDTCCNILEQLFKEKNIAYKRTYFAKLLKKQVAEKYNLDFSKMEDNDYKLSIVEHAEPKIIYWDEERNQEVPHWVAMDPGPLRITQKTKKRTVRDILIEEGCGARAIWSDTWANSVYQELLNTDVQVGFVSDYRFPNEYGCFDRSYAYWSKDKPNWVYTNVNKDAVCLRQKPKVIRVLVHRPDGLFKNDGADGELPDLEDTKAWDYTIINNKYPEWRDIMVNNLKDILQREGLYEQRTSQA